MLAQQYLAWTDELTKAVALDGFLEDMKRKQDPEAMCTKSVGSPEDVLLLPVPILLREVGHKASQKR